MKPRRPFREQLKRWLEQRRAVRSSRVKLGMRGYAFLCAILRDSPCTVLQLTARAEMGHVAAYRFLTTMRKLGRVYISAWHEKPRSPVLPVFALGHGVDVPPPAKRSNGRPVEAIRMPMRGLCPAVVAFEHLLRSIETPASRTEIAEATGLNEHTVATALEALVDLNLAHIPLWMDRPQGGAPLPQFQLGAGTNAPMPVPDRDERRKLHRHRQQVRRVALALSLPAYEMRRAAC